MNYLLNKKALNITPPAALVNNASATCLVIDTQGYADLEIIVILGATDIALTALKVQESDAEASSTSLTSGADITGTRFGTDNNDAGAASTLPSATDDNHLFSFKIDLRGRKRYLLPVITVGNGTSGAYVTVIALLSRPQQGPRLAADAGYTQRMMV